MIVQYHFCMTAAWIFNSFAWGPGLDRLLFYYFSAEVSLPDCLKRQTLEKKLGPLVNLSY